MKLLLDTHAVIWWLGDDDRLGKRARGLIEDPENDVLVSVASLWEMAIKARIGKLEVDVASAAAAIERSGFQILALSIEHLQSLRALPMHHGDPFDHLLAAQTIAEAATLISDDRRMPSYGVTVVRCSGRAIPPP